MYYGIATVVGVVFGGISSFVLQAMRSQAGAVVVKALIKMVPMTGIFWLVAAATFIAMLGLRYLHR